MRAPAGGPAFEAELFAVVVLTQPVQQRGFIPQAAGIEAIEAALALQRFLETGDARFGQQGGVDSRLSRKASRTARMVVAWLCLISPGAVAWQRTSDSASRVARASRPSRRAAPAVAPKAPRMGGGYHPCLHRLLQG
jgi:hypothetical protein